MRRRNIAIVVVVIVAASVLVFFLPVVPVQVEASGQLYIQEQGHASVTLYFTGYGGIYMNAEPNYIPTYVGYCVVYGSSTSCGIGVGLLNAT